MPSPGLTTLSQFKGSCDGFRLVLIGDMHEQPMLHLRVKPFTFGVKDWSGEVSYATEVTSPSGSLCTATSKHYDGGAFKLLEPHKFALGAT